MLQRTDENTRTEYYCISFDGIDFAEQNTNETLSIHCADECFNGACIKCMKPLCTNYYDHEFECREISNFSSSKSSSVCPTNAIQWSNSEQEFSIDHNKCIGCGICASRCPFGAIYSGKNGLMNINADRSNAHYYVIESKENVESEQHECANIVRSKTRSRAIKDINIDHIKRIYSAMLADQELANLLCRNLFISLGFNCAIRRTGDVYTRMDALFSKDGLVSPIEIEYQDDTLSVARNLLDDLAVLYDRYGVDPFSSTPVALCLSIPKTRQGYFQVCEDIKKILGISIRTLTVGSLLVLVWDGSNLAFDEDNFYLSFRNVSIKSDLQKLMDAQLCLDTLDLGIYEATK